MIYENCRVYGPYKRDDGRMHVIVIWPSGLRQTVSYPKFWMEKQLGRYLTNDEEVHHKDEDKTNNDPSNFELRERSEHRREHALIPVGDKEVICFWCERKFTLNKQQQRNRDQGKVGPFCSRRCSGLYGK